MKQSILYAIFFMFFNQTIAQNNFLRDYKAPDFGYRQLNLTFSGDSKTSIDVNSLFNTKGALRYKTYLNTNKIQKQYFANVQYQYNYLEDKIKNIYKSGFDIFIYQSFKRKSYLRKEWYYGLNDYSYFISTTNYKNDSTGVSTGINTNFHLKPGVSFGFGRLEPVTYARKALDLEKLLTKSGVIKGFIDKSELTTIANVLAKIENKRYFDIRLQRIKQLEVLDSVISDLGIITNRTIKYYTAFTDSYLFTHQTNRYSGKQIEFEVVYNNSLSSHVLGVLSYAYHLPQNYSIQHDFYANFTTSFNSYVINSNQPKLIPSVNLDYHLGIYPTTRTFIDIKFNTGKNLTNNNYFFGLTSDLYYYFSPKLRGSFSSKLTYSKGDSYQFYNYLSYYNNYSYTSSSFKKYISFKFGLNYAIF